MPDTEASRRPFDVLFEADPPAAPLPGELGRVYDGGLGFTTPVLYSNFVSSIDGVVATTPRESSGSIISGKYWGDRFVMGLLRAVADAVIVGAGTLNSTPKHAWTAPHVFPDLADDFDSLRRDLGLAPEPRLVVVTASGHVDASHTAIQAGATVVTTEEAAPRLTRELPSSCEVWPLGSGAVDLGAAIDRLHEDGMRTLLTEGGPTLLGSLISAKLLNEVFLTVSPLLAGRDGGEQLGMVEGVSLLPDRGVWSELLSARKSSHYLFLRYRLNSPR